MYTKIMHTSILKERYTQTMYYSYKSIHGLFVCLFIALGPADYIELYQDHSPHLYVWPKIKSTQMVTLKAFR